MNFLKSNKDKTGGNELGSYWCGVWSAFFEGYLVILMKRWGVGVISYTCSASKQFEDKLDWNDHFRDGFSAMAGAKSKPPCIEFYTPLFEVLNLITQDTLALDCSTVPSFITVPNLKPQSTPSSSPILPKNKVNTFTI